MNAGEIVLRPARGDDAGAIASLHRAAFGASGEADLVLALARNGDIVLSMVVASGDAIVGSAVYSRLLIDGANKGATALAPVGVLPERQRQGIGGALIRESHRVLAAAGESLVFVLGDPAYYNRFGFSQDAAKAFQTPYDGPHMMALKLGGNAPERGDVTYAKAFAELA